MTTPTRDTLLAAARVAAQRAYAPYSHFRVGAALALTDASGQPHLITGCNVENASYGLTFCAERNALAAAIAQFADEQGHPPQITALAVACIDAPRDAGISARCPCGACRQWIAELAPHATISLDGVPRDFTPADLLPFAFDLPTG